MQWWWRLGLGPSCHQALLRWEFSLFLPTTIFFPISIVSRQLCCCCCCYRCWKEPWYAFGFSFFPFKQVQRIFDWMTKNKHLKHVYFFCFTNFCRLLLVPPVAEIFLSLAFYRFIFSLGISSLAFCWNLFAAAYIFFLVKLPLFCAAFIVFLTNCSFGGYKHFLFLLLTECAMPSRPQCFFLSRFAISVGHRVSKFNWIFLFCFKFHFHSLTICSYFALLWFLFSSCVQGNSGWKEY